MPPGTPPSVNCCPLKVTNSQRRWILLTQTGDSQPGSGVTRVTCWDTSGLESVAHAGLGQEVPGPRRLRLELAPQLREGDPPGVGFRAVGRPPDLVQDLALAGALGPGSH